MSKHQAQSDRSDDQPVKTADVKRLYQRPPSFTDLLPWAEYLPESRAFLLEDGISVGALFELEPVGTEARTPRFMAELRDAIQTALTDAIPALPAMEARSARRVVPGRCRRERIAEVA